VEAFGKVAVVAGLVLAVLYIVRGLRRKDGSGKILRDSLPIGIPLFLGLGYAFPRLWLVGLAGLVVIVVMMGWNLFRSARE
jgi:hypothetical protein